MILALYSGFVNMFLIDKVRELCYYIIWKGGGIMKNRSLARFVVFALIQVVLCVLAFVFAAGISSAEPEFQTDGSIYVDGTDFTPLAQLGGEILNGALSLLALGASFLVTAVISAVLLVPFRFIAVRKDSILTRIEARGTLIVILVCTAVSLISAAIFGGAGCMVVALVLMIPQLLLSVLMYWLCIFLRSRRQDSVSRDCGA